MNCPDPLPRAHAKALRYKTSKKAIARYLNGEVDWKHGDLKAVRDQLRMDLRKGQQQHCYYCRRLIPVQRRNVGEAIEHFLDKSKPAYKKWGFNPLNLVISCQPCNIVKSTKDLGDNAVKRALFLSAGSGVYSWLHPYFDSYNDNIKVSPGPIYSAVAGSPRYNQAVKMIEDLKLSDLPNLDDRIPLIAKEIQRLQSKMFLMTAPTPHGVSKRREAVRLEIQTRLDKCMFEIFGI